MLRRGRVEPSSFSIGVMAGLVPAISFSGLPTWRALPGKTGYPTPESTLGPASGRTRVPDMRTSFVCLPAKTEALRSAPLGRPRARTRAAGPGAHAHIAGEPPGAGCAAPAGAYRDRDRAGAADPAGHREYRVSAIRQHAV